MNMSDLISQAKNNGYSGNKINTYQSIDIDYKKVNLNKKNKFKLSFGNAYNQKGVYIFSDKNNNHIFYIGEAHNQTIGKRLSAHFREKDQGGLLYKHQKNKTEKKRLKDSNVLILYDNSKKPKDIICLQDLLIGLFEPDWNKQ
jgi:hypothetical protein